MTVTNVRTWKEQSLNDEILNTENIFINSETADNDLKNLFNSETSNVLHSVISYWHG